MNIIESMKEYAETTQVTELLQKLLLETGYEQYIRESGEMDRLDNVSELAKTYMIRFLIGTKPIRFEYQGLSQVF